MLLDTPRFCGTTKSQVWHRLKSIVGEWRVFHDCVCRLSWKCQIIDVDISVSIGNSYSAVAQTAMHWVPDTLIDWEKFSEHAGNCQRNNISDLELCPAVACSRSSDTEKARQPNVESQWCGIGLRTAGGSWQTADAVDRQCRRLGCSISSCTVALRASDADEDLHRVCTTSTR